MKTNEFIMWLRGYMDGVGIEHESRHWRKIQDELAKIDDTVYRGLQTSTPNTYTPQVKDYPKTTLLGKINPETYIR